MDIVALNPWMQRADVGKRMQLAHFLKSDVQACAARLCRDLQPWALELGVPQDSLLSTDAHIAERARSDQTVAALLALPGDLLQSIVEAFVAIKLSEGQSRHAQSASAAFQPLHAVVAQLPAPLHESACHIAAALGALRAMQFDCCSSAVPMQQSASTWSRINERVAELVHSLPQVVAVTLQLTRKPASSTFWTSPASATQQQFAGYVGQFESQAARLAQRLARAPHVTAATVLGITPAGMRQALVPQLRAWPSLRSLTLEMADRASSHACSVDAAGRSVYEPMPNHGLQQLTQLHHLAVRGALMQCPVLSLSISRLTQLTSLVVADTGMLGRIEPRGPAFAGWLKGISWLPNLAVLTMHYDVVTNLAEVAPALLTLAALSRLELQAVQFVDIDGQIFSAAQVLARCSALQSLSLTDSRLDAQDVQRLVPQLSSLPLTRLRFDDAVLENLAMLPHQRLFSCISSLRALELVECMLGDAAMESLAPDFGALDFLTSLDLRKNDCISMRGLQLEEGALSALRLHLEPKQSLQQLYLMPQGYGGLEMLSKIVQARLCVVLGAHLCKIADIQADAPDRKRLRLEGSGTAALR